MQRYIVSRFFQAVVALILLSMVIFVLGRLTGDPVSLMLPPDATQEAEDLLRASLKLDQPWPVQYWQFISGAARLDFGQSIKARRPVTELIQPKIMNSLKLGAAGMVITLLTGIPLGVIAAVKRDTFVDTGANLIAVLGQSLPQFWVGIMLIQVFTVQLGLLPASGTGGFTHYLMPAFTLGWFVTAGVMRLLRSSMLEVLDSEFVKLARIKGLPEYKIIWKHSLKNALIPVLTFSGTYFAAFVTGAILVETVFAWPGLGRLVYDSIIWRDFPVLQSLILMIAAVVIVVNLVVDLLYAYIDPRIRYN
ncbi:MAG: ABC transporter permease [Chloroflexi bacterium]|nr:ABC transporter permease [Chloroflexota bacterium]MDA1220143.1 ABC transporter permease [Chloroflexota bacterium]